MSQPDEQYGSWNPGIQSVLPKELLALSTIFRPENVTTSVPAALELQGLTGLSTLSLASFVAVAGILAGTAIGLRGALRVRREQGNLDVWNSVPGNGPENLGPGINQGRNLGGPGAN